MFCFVRHTQVFVRRCLRRIPLGAPDPLSPEPLWRWYCMVTWMSPPHPGRIYRPRRVGTFESTALTVRAGSTLINFSRRGLVNTSVSLDDGRGATCYRDTQVERAAIPERVHGADVARRVGAILKCSSASWSNMGRWLCLETDGANRSGRMMMLFNECSGDPSFISGRSIWSRRLGSDERPAHC